VNAAHAERECRSAGNDAPPHRPLVLIHGFLGSPDDWSAFETALQKIPHAPRTVRADLVEVARGLIAAGTARPTLPMLACALLGMLRRDSRLQGGFDVVGYSMGGRLALEWMVQGSDGARASADIRVLLASAHPGLEDASERVRRAQVDAHLSERLAGIDEAPTKSDRSSRISALLADWYATPMFTPLTATRAFDGVLKRRREDLESGDAAKCWSAIVAGCSPGTNEPRWGTLQAAGDACLVVTGELDARYFAVVQRSAQLGVATRMMKDAGHALPIEQPDALACLTAAWAAQDGTQLAAQEMNIS